ncbi:hypothetical protein [Methylobrevis albus]|uniref:Uncharacterized protein n=1 Tax=Methylobrevis albus TaxID=2793297 RepID=A0A931MY46_9HYPH|nr:hypothetical protein [Methylobrevis albus]MBH0236336.1 hypothetical protein [Methylobrevis albus]
MKYAVLDPADSDPSSPLIGYELTVAVTDCAATGTSAAKTAKPARKSDDIPWENDRHDMNDDLENLYFIFKVRRFSASGF